MKRLKYILLIKGVFCVAIIFRKSGLKFSKGYYRAGQTMWYHTPLKSLKSHSKYEGYTIY